ncbi:MAG: hypothetical protein ACI4SJ_03380 [Candidatus Avispirillum sp.]
MKKVMKRSICCLVCFIMLLSLSSCAWPGTPVDSRARNGEQWISEDGKVFIMSQDGRGYGYIEYCDEKIPIEFLSANSVQKAYVYIRTSAGWMVYPSLEIWHVGIYFRNHFTAKVQESFFYEQNTIIKFHKLSESEKIDYEPPEWKKDGKADSYVYSADEVADKLLPVIEDVALSEDYLYDPHIIALSLQSYGIKEIYHPYLVSVDDGIMTLSFTDGDGVTYYLTYNLDDSRVTDFGEV